MNHFSRSTLALLTAAVLSFATIGASLAAGHAMPGKLVVKITATPTSPTIWGSVKVTYSSNGKTHTLGTCKTASCTSIRQPM